jgi:hypothetical protein
MSGMKSSSLRNTFRRAASSILALVLLAGSAMAQSADRPHVKVGDQWQFVVYYAIPSVEPNRVWVITSITSTGIEGTENGEPLRFTPDLNLLESPRHQESNPRALSFPLEVGKQWRYTSDWVFKLKGSRGSAVVDVAVVGHEEVRVPAGDFHAFKIVAKGRIRGVSGINSQIDAQTNATYWYAPAARAIVKSVSHNPYLGTSTVELVRVQLRP